MVEVVVFIAVVRFRTLLLSEGDEQVKQVCMAHGVCLVQVWGVSCCGVSMESRTSESEEVRLEGIVESRCPCLSLKCKLHGAL